MTTILIIAGSLICIFGYGYMSKISNIKNAEQKQQEAINAITPKGINDCWRGKWIEDISDSNKGTVTTKTIFSTYHTVYINFDPPLDKDMTRTYMNTIFSELMGGDCFHYFHDECYDNDRKIHFEKASYQEAPICIKLGSVGVKMLRDEGSLNESFSSAIERVLERYMRNSFNCTGGDFKQSAEIKGLMRKIMNLSYNIVAIDKPKMTWHRL